MDTLGNALGTGFLILVAVIGSGVFWVLLQNSIVINPSLMGCFGWWLSCLVGTAVALYLVIDITFGILSWIFEFLKTYYLYIIGAIVVIGGIGALSGKSNKENV